MEISDKDSGQGITLRKQIKEVYMSYLTEYIDANH